MKQIFESIKAKAVNEIHAASDKELFANNFANNLYEKLKIQQLYLKTDNKVVNIDEEVVDMNNPPPNEVGFRPGQKMEFVIYSIPIIGDINVFNKFFKRFTYDKKLYFDETNLYYKEFSTKKISTSESQKNKIKENARKTIEKVKEELTKFNTQLNEFNESNLSPLISKEVEREIKKRNQKKNSEEELNF